MGTWTPLFQKAYLLKMDEASATVTYIGESNPGSAEDSSVWRIKKIDNSVGLVISWASGNANFNKQWTQRANYNYS